MKELQWIKYKDVYEICKDIIMNIEKKSQNAEENLYSNIIDPFSALFDASYHKISLTEWVKKEKIRQVQKSLQNTIGEFHQNILGKINGFNNLEQGHVVDLVCQEKKIIAEVKNKFNTTKGNHKINIYDDLEALIQNQYLGFTGYYVAIISKKKINKPFTPSDNKTHIKRKENNKIREIDGASFYEIATGDKHAIADLYNMLAEIICEITKCSQDKIINDPLFAELFGKAFK